MYYGVGLGEECGEVLGKIKKLHRDFDDELNDELWNSILSNYTYSNYEGIYDNEEDLYQEIDGLFRENVGVFNSYLKDNHIKFEHIFFFFIFNNSCIFFV